MAAVDAQPRLLAVAGADLFAETLHKRLNSPNKWLANTAAETLRSFEYPDADIAKFKAGEITEMEMAQFTQRVVEFTSGSGRKGFRAGVFDNPWGRVLFQGMGYSVEQARNTWRLAGRQLVNAKNPVPAARLLGYTAAVGYGVLKAKDFIRGEEDHRPENLASALHEGGLGGIVGDAAYAAFFDSKNNSFDRFIDGLDDSMFTDMVAEFGRAAGRTFGDRPKGMSKSEAWHHYIKQTFKNEAEWERIVNRLQGHKNPK